MKGPNEKPLGLDIGFDDALRRFLGTDPAELAESVAAEKERKKGQPKPPLGVDGESPGEATARPLG